MPLMVFLALHVLAVLAIRHDRHPSLMENGAIATHLFEGRGFSMPVVKPDEDLVERPAAMQVRPTSNQAPGYPYLLCGIWSVFGRTPTAHLFLSLVQVLLLSTIVVPLYALARSWFGSKAARVTAWMVVVAPLYLWYGTRFHPTVLVMAFQPWLVWAWLNPRHVERPARIALLGLATATLGLLQPVTLGFFGLLGAWLLVSALRQRRWIRVRGLLAVAAVVALGLLPWTVRNARVHGRLIAVKNCFGKELWIGNPPSAGWSIPVYRNIPLADAIRPEWLDLGEMDMMDAMQQEALAAVRRNPGAFLSRTVQRIVFFWTAMPLRYLNPEDQQARRQLFALQTTIWFGLLFFAVFARLRGGPFPASYLALLAIALLVYSMTYGLTHAYLARFRGEIEFLIFPAAAQGLTLAWSRWRASKRPL